MKIKLWMVDWAFAVIMIALFGIAYHFDGPADPRNAIKPVTTRTHDDKRLLCADGQSPVDWLCPDGTRL